MTIKKQLNLLNQLSVWGLIAILVIMPFHAFLSVVLGSVFGYQAAFQAWKEVLFVGLAAIWLYNCVLRKKLLFKFSFTNLTVLAIILLGIGVSIIYRPNLNGLIFGVKTNLVPLGLFLIAQAYAADFGDNKLLRLVLLPALIVSVLAILQVTVIPYQLLQLIGYNPMTINPLQVIDASSGIARAFATLGGPNQMGTYMILPVALALAALIRTKRLVYLPILAFLLVALGLSFSRSSWLGAIVAITLVLFLFLPAKFKIIMAASLAGLVLIGYVLLAPQLSNSNNVVLQNIFLHGQFFSNKTIGPPDVVRGGALARGYELFIKQPWGHGLGTAGPASYYSPNQLITENWYLQIGYEYGWLGILAYLVLFGSLVVGWLRQPKTEILIGAAAALIGILIANLFLHSWADSSLALVAFTFFGVIEGRKK
ncbi:O-antigen ligase family protein [Candidatus Saccharibacteria bacterium]|nr:O-antigen ligase family protein [Candidatus Saccharibacteria bacterium]